MTSRVVRTKLHLLLEVGGLFYKCSSMTMTHALNAIPKANCSLAIGRDVRSLEAAMIHHTADQFTTMLPAKIHLIPEGEWSERDSESPDYGPGVGRWTDAGRQVIFDGYITGGGWQKRRGQVNYSINLIHWLSDLAFSSTLSNQSHPSNPGQFRFRSVYGAYGVATQARSNFIADSVTQSLFSAGSVQEDLWGSALHRMFCEMAEEDILDPSPAASDNCFGVNAANAQSQAALQRFELKLDPTVELPGQMCPTDGPAGDVGRSPYFKPLNIKGGESVGDVASAIGTWCRRRTLDSYFHKTAWDAIVGELGAHLYFAVVPKVNTAMVVPFVPGLRQTYDQEFNNGKVLDVNHFSYINTNAFIPRPLRAVGVLQQPVESYTGSTGDDTAIKRSGGCYAPDGATGMILFKPAPGWLSRVPADAHSPKRTALAPSGRQGSATTPVLPGGSVGNDSEKTPAMLANATQGWYTDVAKYFYAQEMLRGRSAVVQSKLRFDLAPGTSLAIRNQDPRFLAGDQLNRDMVGTLVRVGSTIDAENRNAGTALQLEYVRSASENESDRTSVGSHPLYSSAFTGSPLLHAYAFPE